MPSTEYMRKECGIVNRCNSNKNRRKSGKKYAFICSVMLFYLLILTSCGNGKQQADASMEGQTNQSAGNGTSQDTGNGTAQDIGNQTNQDTVDTVDQGTGTQMDIGLEQAKDAALSHAGLEASAVTFTKEKLDYDDGQMEYEIEFYADDKEYSYTIHGDTGEILDVETEMR